MVEVFDSLISVSKPTWSVNISLVSYATSAALVSFVICFCCVLPIAIKSAKFLGLLDRPDARKMHSQLTPAVGGISILITVIGVSVLLGREWVNWSMMLWLVVVLGVGVADDKFDLSSYLRLVLYSLIVVGIAATDGYFISHLGYLFNDSISVQLSPVLAIAFTVFAVVGAVCAVNMMDGLDGLLGTLIVVSLSALLLISLSQPDNSGFSRIFSSRDIACLLGALSAFVVMNTRIRRSHARVFLGDAGSVVLGFVVVYLLIDYSQSKSPIISPVDALWILGLPLVDGVAVILTRLCDRKSPINGGRDHMHHRLIASGLSVNQTLVVMVSVHMVLVAVGVIGTLLRGNKYDFVLLCLFLLVVVMRARFTDYIGALISKIKAKSPGINSKTDNL